MVLHVIDFIAGHNKDNMLALLFVSNCYWLELILVFVQLPSFPLFSFLFFFFFFFLHAFLWDLLRCAPILSQLNSVLLVTTPFWKENFRVFFLGAIKKSRKESGPSCCWADSYLFIPWLLGTENIVVLLWVVWLLYFFCDSNIREYSIFSHLAIHGELHFRKQRFLFVCLFRFVSYGFYHEKHYEITAIPYNWTDMAKQVKRKKTRQVAIQRGEFRI